MGLRVWSRIEFFSKKINIRTWVDSTPPPIKTKVKQTLKTILVISGFDFLYFMCTYCEKTPGNETWSYLHPPYHWQFFFHLRAILKEPIIPNKRTQTTDKALPPSRRPHFFCELQKSYFFLVARPLLTLSL